MNHIELQEETCNCSMHKEHGRLSKEDLTVVTKLILDKYKGRLYILGIVASILAMDFKVFCQFQEHLNELRINILRDEKRIEEIKEKRKKEKHDNN